MTRMSRLRRLDGYRDGSRPPMRVRHRAVRHRAVRWRAGRLRGNWLPARVAATTRCTRWRRLSADWTRSRTPAAALCEAHDAPSAFRSMPILRRYPLAGRESSGIRLDGATLVMSWRYGAAVAMTAALA